LFYQRFRFVDLLDEGGESVLKNNHRTTKTDFTAERNTKIDPPYFTTCHFLKPPEHSLSLRHNKAFALKEGFLQEQN
jgi:hypothetical protein